MSRNRKRKTGRKQPADVTRSPRQRAGSRRNKRLHNVATFTSDQPLRSWRDDGATGTAGQ